MHFLNTCLWQYFKIISSFFSFSLLDWRVNWGLKYSSIHLCKSQGLSRVPGTVGSQKVNADCMNIFYFLTCIFFTFIAFLKPVSLLECSLTPLSMCALSCSVVRACVTLNWGNLWFEDHYFTPSLSYMLSTLPRHKYIICLAFDILSLSVHHNPNHLADDHINTRTILRISL